MRTGNFHAAQGRIAALALGALLLFGCASTTPKAALRQDAGHAGDPRGSRSIFLLVRDSQRHDTQGTMARRGMGVHLRKAPEKDWEFPQRITLAKVVGDRGQTICTVVVPVSSRELLTDALQQELTASGYQVHLVRKLPVINGSGITMAVEVADLTQHSGFFAVEGNCRLRVTSVLWENGVKLASNTYQAQQSDSASQAPNLLLRRLLAAAARDVAKRSAQQALRDLPLSRK